MPKVYLLIYGRVLGTRDEVKACLDAIPEIIEWRTEFPNSFYIISEKEAVDLVPLIKQCRGDNEKAGFLLTEIGPNRQGWLSPGSWPFIRQEKGKS
jgi:hypothetical protein